MRSPQSTLAVMSLIAAGLAGLVTALRPFDHGVWLIAYLFLVGFAAQYLLGRWQASLSQSAALARLHSGFRPRSGTPG